MIFFLLKPWEIPISFKSSSFKVARVPPLILFSSKSLMYSSLILIVLSHSHNSLVVIFSAFPLGLADNKSDATGVLTGTGTAGLGTAGLGTAGLGTAGSAIHRRIKLYDILLVCCILYFIVITRLRGI